MPRWSWPLAGVASVTFAAGLSIYTLVEGQAFSYMSSRSEACVNCHVMQPQYDGWQRGSHHQVARCGDCHLPHDFAGKYIAKMRNGWHHSSAFTTGDFSEPIRITGTNAVALEANCRRCHADLVAHLGPGPSAPLPCVHCHSQVGHPSPAGIGGPLAATDK